MAATTVYRKIAVLLATPVIATALWAGDPWIGTWKLNHAKSDSYPTIPKSQILIFEVQGEGVKTTEQLVTAKGQEYSVHWTANYDGKDYPVVGSRAGVEWVSIRRTDANTFECETKKKDRSVSSIYKIVVSPDGKFFTIHSGPEKPTPDRPPRVRIFDRQ